MTCLIVMTVKIVTIVIMATVLTAVSLVPASNTANKMTYSDCKDFCDCKCIDCRDFSNSCDCSANSNNRKCSNDCVA